MPTNVWTIHKGWRLVEERDGEYYALFHGRPGKSRRTRHLPTGTWLKAEQKTARTSKYGQTYTTGFHTFNSWLTAYAYTKKFRAKKVTIVRCKVSGVATKPGWTNYTVWLADRLFIYPPGAEL